MSLIVLESGLYDGLIGAAIGAAITLITTVITFVIGFKNIGFSYKSLFAETVSSNRNNWINVWRDEVSKFLAISDILRYEKKYGEKRKGRGKTMWFLFLWIMAIILVPAICKWIDLHR